MPRHTALDTFLAEQRLLVIAPHADDEVAGAAGLYSQAYPETSDQLGRAKAAQVAALGVAVVFWFIMTISVSEMIVQRVERAKKEQPKPEVSQSL